jgi:glycosyltransferase involved in cell wall biosynthesis
MRADREHIRVLIASRLFAPEVSAGAFRLAALAAALAKRGAVVTVVTTNPPPTAPRTAEMPAVQVRRWPVLRDRGGNVRGYLQYTSFDAPLAFRLLFRRFDVVVAEAPPTTGLVTALVAAVRGRPFAYYAADVWSDGVAAVGAPRAVTSAIRSMEAFVLRRARRVLSPSRGVTDRLIALGARPERIALVGHGIDTDAFAPGASSAARPEPYFVYTGTMSEVHSPQVFVRAFSLIASEYPTLRVRFFGQGVYESELRELAERLVPGRIDFGGVISPADTATWISGAVGALVSLTPGIGYDYAHPTKTYAAAACGTPVLFAGPTAFGALVRESALGEAVDHDPRAVADAMRRLLAAAESGETERLRAERVAWTRENASLSAVGRRAANAVLEVVSGESKRTA